jgi:multidrug efflux pump subunit AcrA (membrane-fusion protein)
MTIVERGTVQPFEFVEIVCPIRAKKGATSGTTIKNIYVEDGELVMKGQLLIQLDDSEFRDQLPARKIALEKATADKAIAEENVKVVQKQNQLDLRAAEITLKIAQLELKRFAGKDPDAKEVLQLKVDQAKVAVEAIKLQAKAKVVKAEMDLKVKTALEVKEANHKREIEAQIDQCAIRAPKAGFVMYVVPEQARFGSNRDLLAEGEPVRQGQKLMRIPNLARMQLSIRVHEALVRSLEPGQPAVIRLDAFPDKVLRGRVNWVAKVASQQDWMAADVKVFQALVLIDKKDTLRGLKPGMSAEVNILVSRQSKVLQVPVDSILRDRREIFCYVKSGKGLKERKVNIGESNDVFVEIKDGLEEGEQVLLAPRAIVRRLVRPAGKNSKQALGQRAARILVRSVRPPADSAVGRRTRIASYGLTYGDLAHFKALPDVTEVVPVRAFRIDARRGLKLHVGRILATVPAFADLANVHLDAGRFLETADNTHMRNVAVLGCETAERLFPLQEPVGQVVFLGQHCSAYRVVGVLARQDSATGIVYAEDLSHGVFIPLRTCKAWFGRIIIDRTGGRFSAEEVPLTEILLGIKSPQQADYITDWVAARLDKTHARKDWEIITPRAHH